jgi:hypothetical protein
MNPITLGTAVGAAAVAVGSGALGAVSNSLSFAAELARAAKGSPGSAPSQNRPPDPRTALEPRIVELRQRAEERLREAGIDLSQPVELTTNGHGGIAVAEPHPQQAAIEAALASDVLLEHDFNKLAREYAELSEQAALGAQASSLAPAQAVGPFSLTIRAERRAGGG